MTSKPLIINDLLKIIRELCKQYYSDPVLKDFYMDVGLSVKSLLDRNELTFFDNWHDIEVRRKIYAELHDRRAKKV